MLYLPGYSPEYNLIEEAFSKIKEILHKAAARTREALVEALGLALSAVSREDARGFSSLPDGSRQANYYETCCQ